MSRVGSLAQRAGEERKTEKREKEKNNVDGPGPFFRRSSYTYTHTHTHTPEAFPQRPWPLPALQSRRASAQTAPVKNRGGGRFSKAAPKINRDRTKLHSSEPHLPWRPAQP